MNVRRLALAILLAWLPHAQAALPEPVLKALEAAEIPQEAVGAIVIRGDTLVLDHYPERAMQPASTMKLVTTMAGLEVLGPVFRGRTELLSAGEVKGDVLKGDLVLRGGADLDLTAFELERMLQKLRNRGIRRIDGDLMVDRTLFTPTRLDVGVPPFDESPEAYYNVIPDAALVNANMLEIDMRATDKAIKLAVYPQLDRVSVTSEMELIDGDCANWEEGWKLPEVTAAGDKLTVVLRGSFPKSCSASNSINVIDRQEYVARVFKSAWKRLGGAMRGKVTEGRAPEGAELLAQHFSRTLPELVRHTNKPSDNLLARTIYLSMGALEPDPALGSHAIPGIETQTTLVRADATVRAWLRSHGIGDDGLVIENGSGLSRLERITPLQMAGVLQAALKSNWLPEFAASLPIVGVDGTMRRRLNGSPAAQRARLKTGTLRNVVAVAGYVPDAQGRQCVVVAFVNDERAGNGNGRAITDALIDWVARNGAAPE